MSEANNKDISELFDLDQSPQELSNGCTYKYAYVDSDTAVIHCAMATQDDLVKVVHKPTGKSKVYKKVSDWRGLSLKNPSEKWKELYDKVPESKKHLYTIDQFEEISLPTIKTPKNPMNTIVEEACAKFDFFVGIIKKYSQAEDYRLLIGGNGKNPRFDWARIQKYKGERKAKPILFNEVKQYILKKYKKKIILIDDKEADDEIARLAWKDYQNFLKTGKHDYVFSFIDKDLKVLPSINFNYGNPKDGHKHISYDEGIKNLCYQMILGDKVDNIRGIDSVSNEIKTKHGCRKGKGAGKKIAEALALEAETAQDALWNILEAYQECYGAYSFEFTDWEGNTSTRTWWDMMEENLKLLWMYRDNDMQWSLQELIDEVLVDETYTEHKYNNKESVDG